MYKLWMFEKESKQIKDNKQRMEKYACCNMGTITTSYDVMQKQFLLMMPYCTELFSDKFQTKYKILAVILIPREISMITICYWTKMYFIVHLSK